MTKASTPQTYVASVADRWRTGLVPTDGHSPTRTKAWFIPKFEVATKGYDTFLVELKDRIRTAQLRAAVAVNRELIELYWQIGRDIVARQETMAGASRSSSDWRAIFSLSSSG